MNRYTNSCIPAGVLHRLMIIALLFISICFFWGRAVHATIPTNTSDLVQFIASGHVLGFDPEGVYIASSDHVLRVDFAGTDGVKPMADRMEASEGHAQPLRRVDYPELWPGISLRYEAVSGGIVQSSYLIEPGADVGQIRLRYNAPLEIEAGGSLRIGYKHGWMRESAPVAWQEINGQRISVSIAFSLYDSSIKKSMIGFSLGQYNPAYPLMIDPTLNWNTFMGSTNYDTAHGIAVDGNGNVYVAGISAATWGSPVNTHSGGLDAFTAKLNSSGELQWNTFMGSVALDIAQSIALDANGNVYLAGYSTATWGSPLNGFTGNTDAFVAKLSSNGALQWNTFMGSAEANGIAVDGSGNVYVAGSSSSTWGSPVNGFMGISDAFAAKLNSNGVLQWNTFMGSEDRDSAFDIAVDGSGNVYVAGSSSSTWGSPLNGFMGISDAFAAKLNDSGVLQWNTFMGLGDPGYGSYDHAGAYVSGCISVDYSGNIYVAGFVNFTWENPWGITGDSDAFVVKLSSNGVLQWHFKESANSVEFHGIAVDEDGNVFVAGYSGWPWGLPVNGFSGNFDAFVAKLNSSGDLQWNMFMGPGNWDSASSIALDSSGNVYVAGRSDAKDKDATQYDAYVTKLPVSIDSDMDGLIDDIESTICTDPNDADSDDDGILDGMEDADKNGVVDIGETDPCDADTDDDGVQDGTESGYYLFNVGTDTDQSFFQPDEDPYSITDPTNEDTDGDGSLDGDEDANHNGAFEDGETDPINPGSKDDSLSRTAVKGTVTYDGAPVTAMVLANGKYMFTSGGEGRFNLMDVPLDANGEITVFAFCSGLAPYKTILSAGAYNLEIEMLKDESGKQLTVKIDSISESSMKPKWYDISGTIQNESGTPLIAMALANGQCMFTKDPVGEFNLTVPLDSRDRITFFGFCSGFSPYRVTMSIDTIGQLEDPLSGNRPHS